MIIFSHSHRNKCVLLWRMWYSVSAWQTPCTYRNKMCEVEGEGERIFMCAMVTDTPINVNGSNSKNIQHSIYNVFESALCVSMRLVLHSNRILDLGAQKKGRRIYCLHRVKRLSSMPVVCLRFFPYRFVCGIPECDELWTWRRRLLLFSVWRELLLWRSLTCIKNAVMANTHKHMCFGRRRHKFHAEE